MNTRRSFILSITAGLVAVGLVAGSALADELLGVLTKVDVEGKKITVTPKGGGDDVVVTITDKTEQVNKKGTAPVDLEKLSKALSKATDAGKKVQLKIEHEKAVASKIQLGGAGKKGQPKKDN